MQNFLTHILRPGSFFAICYFHNQNIRVFLAWKKVALFVQLGYKAFHCVHTVFVPVFQCHALKRHRPIDKKFFFLAPEFINSMISQYNGEYGLSLTTQNVCKKIMHALHFK